MVLRLTGLYALRPLRGLGFRKTAVGLTPFVRFCSSTFFCARKNASHFSLSGTKKRRIQPGTLYAMCPKISGDIEDFLRKFL
jgi:hypothetical protein